MVRPEEARSVAAPGRVCGDTDIVNYAIAGLSLGGEKEREGKVGAMGGCFGGCGLASGDGWCFWKLMIRSPVWHSPMGVVYRTQG